MAKKKALVSEQDEAAGEVAKWVAEIKLYQKEADPWIERSKKIVRRFKDERNARENKSRYNILWSNVQTLLPAIYAKNPVPNVERRFQDDDNLSRVSSDVLERSVSYYVKEDGIHSIMEQVVLDRLLSGRGVAWVRYVPNFKDVEIVGNEEVKGEGVQTTDDVYSEPKQDLYSEEVVADYIHWQDFGHTWARTWEEVRAVWKKVFLTREELVERFGENGNLVPLDHSPEKLNDAKVEETLKKATVYEIWDKPSQTVIWIHKDVPTPLDKRPDPLRLKGFFPCPKPLFATLGNDSIIPVPDYVEYQDQASELDELTGRIRSITKSLKVVGVYDSSAEGVQRMLAEGMDNTLIKVDQYAMLAEKGGLKGVVDLMPMQEIAQTLISLYEAREKTKQDLYEITGISDIVRGATDPNETLGAQELKGQYANLRLGRMQKDAERFSRDLVRIMAEIISEHFSLETIKNISGIKLLTQAEKAQIQLAIQPPQGIPPLPPPPELAKLMQNQEKLKEMMDNPTWEEVYTLLKNDQMRCFRIDVETDSTIKADQEAEKAARTQLLGAAGGFIQQMAMVQDPKMRPMLMEMLMWGVRGFKVGKDLEGTFKVALEEMQKQADMPQQPQPDPDMIKAQAQAEQTKAQMMMDQQRLQAELQAKQADMQLKVQDGQAKTQAETAKQQLEVQKANAEFLIKQEELKIKNIELQLKAEELQIRKLETGAKIEIEHKKIDSAAKQKQEEESAKSTEKAVNGDTTNQVLKTLGELTNAHAETNKAVVEAATKPKKVKVTRQKDGSLIGEVE